MKSYVLFNWKLFNRVTWIWALRWATERTLDLQFVDFLNYCFSYSISLYLNYDFFIYIVYRCAFCLCLHQS